MNRRHILSLSVMTALGLALLTGSALAQQKSLKEQLVGTWILVSNENVLPDGSKRQLFGANPKGSLMLDSHGRYSQIYLTSGVAKFKANNRLEGTAEENKAVVQGTTAQFGTWSVDEASKTLVLSIEGNMYPNLAGTESKRTATVTGDELKLSNPAPGAGGRSETVLKRVK
jgi:hypothetical protein